MDSLDIYQNNCRICLEKPAVLDWNEEIPYFCGTTYKCCYFIYTQLDEQDVFSQMLCATCASDLRNAHLLIQKAHESHRILQQTLQINIKVDKDIQKHQATPDTIDFETVFLKQSETEPLTELQNGENEHFRLSMDESSLMKNVKTKAKTTTTTIKVEDDDTDNTFPDVVEKLVDVSQFTEDLNSSSMEDKTKVSSKKVKNKTHKMCPYCSKLILAENIRLHEETHKADRKRTEMCPECGIKLFNKRTMYSHMLTHKKNREKKYKCEFCEKSYYDRGSLTVHQRIHLGQMISCPICSKEFYRQSELDRHNVKSHAAASLLHTNFDRNKYFVECKDCGKSIPSHIWKCHRDTHLKKFQMKCTLCDKHFVAKSTCHKHVKRVHKKGKEDYAKVVLYYGEDINTRTSHLMIKQTEQLKPISEQ